MDLLERIQNLPPADRNGFVRTLTNSEREALAELLANPLNQISRMDWHAFRRPEQTPPEGDWDTWAIKAGRGTGKTKTAAETLREWALEHPYTRWALVGPIRDDVKFTMIEGESGLLSCFVPSELAFGDPDKAYNRSELSLTLANGSRFFSYSSERPARLRGPQHHGGWFDEIAEFADADQHPMELDTCWSNYQFGLRLRAPGWKPRTIVTGTPKPVAVITGRNDEPGILDLPHTVVTVMRTSENLANLTDDYRRRVIDPIVGTRIARQELDAEVLEEVEGALIDLATIEEYRHHYVTAADLAEPTLGVDPAYSDRGKGDEVGVILGGRTEAGVTVAVEDHSGQLGDRWAELVVRLALEHSARISIERNGANDHLAETLRAAVETLHPGVKLTRRDVNLGGQKCKAWYLSLADGRTIEVFAHWASASKASRLSTMAQTMRAGTLVMPAKGLRVLEDELTSWVPGVSKKSPNRADALDYMRLGVARRTHPTGAVGRMTRRA